MAQYPYHAEPTHDRGTYAARTTGVSSAEERLIVDAVDKINLLEPRLIGPLYSNIDEEDFSVHIL